MDEANEPLEKIVAPFTAEQVDALAKWQSWGPKLYVCPQHGYLDMTTISTDGIRCAAEGCTHAQDWAFAFTLDVKYCTKDAPYVPGDPKVFWIHVDAKETTPDYDGDLVPFHCPNCDLDFDVDFS